MPHLSAVGLSEGWLLKELGHRHWLKLAEVAGMAVPAFRDEAGAPVYPAFCVVAIHDADLGAARENDVLLITSDLARLSRTQLASRHRLTVSGRPAGTVELVSTFVRRTAAGNHAVARVAVDGLPPVDPIVSGLATTAADFRAGRVRRHMGFDLQADPIASYEFDPCPSQDFNGAGFLYFTSFLAFVDRAEWAFAKAGGLRRREIFFYGNLDPGERLTIVPCSVRPDAGLAHHCRIERDGMRLADVFTVKDVQASRSPCLSRPSPSAGSARRRPRRR